MRANGHPIRVTYRVERPNAVRFAARVVARVSAETTPVPQEYPPVD